MNWDKMCCVITTSAATVTHIAIFSHSPPKIRMVRATRLFFACNNFTVPSYVSIIFESSIFAVIHIRIAVIFCKSFFAFIKRHGNELKTFSFF
ncbi:MAG: YgjV family protein [Quinella sp. 1Q5]|nr:YgjV family protein [Quinella sp. 1Q5]